MLTIPNEERPAAQQAIAAPAQAPQRRACACGSSHECDRALEDIFIPEEDSRLRAKARVDFGLVPIGGSFSAAIAGQFNIRIHVPRALQQLISGNGLVGSVLGSARISADISDRVGTTSQAQPCAADLCLFVDFHEKSRGHWMVDLRMLRGGRLRVPVRVDAVIPSPATSPALSKSTPTGVVPVELVFDEDAAASFGPITVLSGSVSDLWRSIRDQVRCMLAFRIESIAASEVARMRAALLASLRNESGEPSVAERPGGRLPHSLI